MGGEGVPMPGAITPGIFSIAFTNTEPIRIFVIFNPNAVFSTEGSASILFGRSERVKKEIMRNKTNGTTITAIMNVPFITSSD